MALEKVESLLIRMHIQTLAWITYKGQIQSRIKSSSDWTQITYEKKSHWCKIETADLSRLKSISFSAAAHYFTSPY